MGQKVNPIGLRLGINRGWDSVWYAKKKDFGNYLIEDFKIREYIKKNVVNSGVSKVMIERTTKKMFCNNLYFKTRICNWKKRKRHRKNKRQTIQPYNK